MANNQTEMCVQLPHGEIGRENEAAAEQSIVAGLGAHAVTRGG